MSAGQLEELLAEQGVIGEFMRRAEALEAFLADLSVRWYLRGGWSRRDKNGRLAAAAETIRAQLTRDRTLPNANGLLPDDRLISFENLDVREILSSLGQDIMIDAYGRCERKDEDKIKFLGTHLPDWTENLGLIFRDLTLLGAIRNDSHRYPSNLELTKLEMEYKRRLSELQNDPQGKYFGRQELDLSLHFYRNKYVHRCLSSIVDNRHEKLLQHVCSEMTGARVTVDGYEVAKTLGYSARFKCAERAALDSFQNYEGLIDGARGDDALSLVGKIFQSEGEERARLEEALVSLLAEYEVPNPEADLVTHLKVLATARAFLSRKNKAWIKYKAGATGIGVDFHHKGGVGLVEELGSREEPEVDKLDEIDDFYSGLDDFGVTIGATLLREIYENDERIRDGKDILKLKPKQQLLILLYARRFAWLSTGGSRRLLIYAVTANSADVFNHEAISNSADVATKGACEILQIDFGAEFNISSEKYAVLLEIYSFLNSRWSEVARPIEFPRFQLVEELDDDSQLVSLRLADPDYPLFTRWETETRLACADYPGLLRYVQLDSRD